MRNLKPGSDTPDELGNKPAGVVSGLLSLSAGVEPDRLNSGGASYGDEIEKGSLLDYWRVLSLRKGTLTALAGGGFLVGILVTLSQSPVYQARSTIEIKDLSQDFLNIKQASPAEGSLSPNALTDPQTQMQILQSESLIERTLNKLNISSLAVLNPKTSPMARWRWTTPAAGRNQLIETASKMLKVSVAAQTRIIELSFQSTDPAIASGFPNALASVFIEQNAQTRAQFSQRTAAWLAQQINDLRGNLRRSEDSLEAYARQSGLVYTGNKENVSTERLRQLQAQVSQAQGDLALREARFRTASTAAPETLPDVLNDNSLRALRNKITDLRSQEADLATTFKPEYSKAKRTRAEIATLESALEHEKGEIVARITNDYIEAGHHAGLLADAYKKQVKLVMQDSQSSIQYDILKRDVDTNTLIYESMLQRVKEFSIASALKTSNIRILDPARTPDRPYKPSMPLNAAAGLLGGLMFGIVIAVTRERVDRTLHQPGDAGRTLGLPELGVIPRALRSGKDGSGAAVSLAPTTKGRNAHVAAMQNMPTDFADSFRAILASIIFSMGKQGRKVLVISSAGPNEGKTTVASNLAVALAKIGQTVLLIDGDIRKPSVHEAFGLDNTNGLTNLLNQLILDGDAANAAIQETDFQDLQVLTSGPALLTGCDLLFTTSMPRLIAYYKDQFDMIIIDTPPLLHMPDARMLGRMSDGVVLVARAGHTLREAALAACERLVQDRTPVLGVILNDWNPRYSPDGYYGNYKDAVIKRYNISRK